MLINDIAFINARRVVVLYRRENPAYEKFRKTACNRIADLVQRGIDRKPITKALQRYIDFHNKSMFHDVWRALNDALGYEFIRVKGE